MKYFFIAFFFHCFINLTGQTNEYLFIPNKNQWPSQVEFKSNVQGGALFLEKNQLVYDFYDEEVIIHTHASDLPHPEFIQHHAFAIQFKNCNSNVEIIKSGYKEEYFNYYLGSDPSHWTSNVHPYTFISYQKLYPGIDLNIYTNNRQLKYDFVIAPNVDPNQILLQYQGDVQLKLIEEALHIKTSINEIIEERPIAYQVVNGRTNYIPCQFKIEKNVVSFLFPEGYDSQYELVIDPTLIFSTYSGSNANNFGYSATFDNDGNLYAGGSVFGTGYPITLGAYNQSFSGGTVDIGITKYASDGTSRIYSTYLGGSENELPHSLIVNSNNELIVFGTTGSNNFPVSSDAIQSNFNGGSTLDVSQGIGLVYQNGTDFYITKFNELGTNLLQSTYFGGSENEGLNTAGALRYNYADEIRGEVEIDLDGNIYIASCTYSTDYPILNGFQTVHAGGQEGCITKFNASINAVEWSSFLGGTSEDALFSIALNENNQPFVTGGTVSSDFPASVGVIQETYQGGRSDGFVTQIEEDGSGILISTFLGTPEYDQSYFVELDDDQNVYLFGQTENTTANFVVNAGYSVPNSGQFITKLTPDLSAYIWSTTFGTGDGTINISPTAFLVDKCNRLYLSGWGGSTNNLGSLDNNASSTNGLATTADAYQSTTDGSDFYLMILSDDCSSLDYGSFFGGNLSAEHVDGGTSRFDKKGKVYQSVCAGCGGNSDFPFYPDPGGVSAVNNASCNNGVFKFDFDIPAIVADFNVPDFICEGSEVTIENTSLDEGNSNFYWEFHDGSNSTDFQPTISFDTTGTFDISLIVIDSNMCNIADTIIQSITILEDTIAFLDSLILCEGTGQIGFEAYHSNDFEYTWTPSSLLNDTTTTNPEASITDTTTFMLIASNGSCIDTFYQTAIPSLFDYSYPNDSVFCSTNNAFELVVNGVTSAQSYLWSSNDNFTDTLNNFPSDSSALVNLNIGENTFYLQITDENNCISTAETNITVPNNLTNLEINPAYCEGDSIYLNLSANGSPEFEWQPTSLIDTIIGNTLLLSPLPGDNELTVNITFEDGCTITDTLDFYYGIVNPDVLSPINGEDTIFIGGSTSLMIEDTGAEYHWTPSNSLDDPTSATPIASPSETTTYTVEITDPNNPNCTKTESFTVYVLEFVCDEPNIFVPNAFTPNGDGENDLLYVRGQNVTEIYFAVYDRWGEKLFETTDQNLGWDGTFKNEILDPAVFVYYLELTCEGGETYFKKGNVTLIR